MHLLRGSGRHSGTDYRFEGIVDGNGGSGVAHEAELLAFADSALGVAGHVDETRSALVAVLGSDAMTDAAAVIAGFDAITRVADGSGIPLEPARAEATAEWRASLGVDAYWMQKV
ncbi:MAG: hypothetical protein GEV13_17315 [Rhodospirillales bacterium]|nr:hypothetical protein [Rhodospirillales bacterium]